MFDLLLRKEWRLSELYGAPAMWISTVAYYRPGNTAEPVATNPWPSRPTRRNKYAMLNCARYRVTWLPDMPRP